VQVRRPVVLTPTELHTVRSIVEAVIPGAQVRVFGSRSTGTARPFSDLDLLVVDPVQLSWRQRAGLRERFEASALPFRVDVVEATGLSEGMAERVWLESVPL
jgi:predicted nucleotidyltransferase